MANFVYSSPKALIKINSQVAGYVRNLTFSEQLQRAPIQGVGNLLKKEVPVVSFDGTFTVDQWFLDFKQPVMEELMHRNGSVNEVVDTLILGELTFTIDMYYKTIVSQDSDTKLITESDPTGETICQLGPCYVNNQQFQITDQGVAGWNVSGIYLNPITTNNI